MLNTSFLKSAVSSLALAAAVTLAVAPSAYAKPKVGAPAPSFSGMTADGKTVSLDDLKGKTVVLEWTNKDCPYVRKHYGTENMQTLQRESKSDHGVMWVSVISSAPGTQGYLEPDEARANVSETKAAPDHVVLDSKGAVGRAYAAVTTPHMFIIDAEGTLRFMGGIDNMPSADWGTVKGAKNYVRAALDDMSAGRDVAEAVTRPYGCSVKYGS